MIPNSTGNPMYDWFGLNRELFLFINGLHTPFLDWLMVSASAIGHPRMYPFYMAVLLLLHWRGRAVALRGLATLAIAYPTISMAIVPVMKASLDFPRPIAALGPDAVTILGEVETNGAFPSGHAAFAVLIAASLMPGASRATRLALAVGAILVCLSRVWVGAHFPADVVGGALISIAGVAAIRIAIGERAG
jgi:membrane-associated phospholipid phosphatase